MLQTTIFVFGVVPFIQSVQAVLEITNVLLKIQKFCRHTHSFLNHLHLHLHLLSSNM